MGQDTVFFAINGAIGNARENRAQPVRKRVNPWGKAVWKMYRICHGDLDCVHILTMSYAYLHFIHINNEHIRVNKITTIFYDFIWGIEEKI